MNQFTPSSGHDESDGRVVQVAKRRDAQVMQFAVLPRAAIKLSGLSAVARRRSARLRRIRGRALPTSAGRDLCLTRNGGFGSVQQREL